jgi:uroporphyrin-III C-methyltransferase
MRGKVYLAGAGPGDPELLTVKTTRLLRAADVVLHDDLVAPEILKLVPAQAKVHNVGKRCGKKEISQGEINFLMVGNAALGMTVVRLKSGDPLIFGRLGEEIEALRKAGVEFEIVPGVTSAFGAAASSHIPLTHRRVSSAVVLLTGQRASGNEEPDWQNFVSSGATLVIYMPGHRYSEIAARLTAAGAVGKTPCAIISRATTPDQQTFVTSLEALHRAPRLPAPTLLVVGEVVRCSHDFEPQFADMRALLGHAVRAGEEEESVA